MDLDLVKSLEEEVTRANLAADAAEQDKGARDAWLSAEKGHASVTALVEGDESAPVEVSAALGTIALWLGSVRPEGANFDRTEGDALAEALNALARIGMVEEDAKAKIVTAWIEATGRLPKTGRADGGPGAPRSARPKVDFKLAYRMKDGTTKRNHPASGVEIGKQVNEARSAFGFKNKSAEGYNAMTRALTALLTTNSAVEDVEGFGKVEREDLIG